MLTHYHRPLIAVAPNPDASEIGEDGIVNWEGPFPSMPDLNPHCEDFVDLLDENNEAAHGPNCWFPWQGFLNV